MKQLNSIKNLKKEYNLTTPELLKVLHGCVKYYLSEEEFSRFVYELFKGKEVRINKRLQV